MVGENGENVGGGNMRLEKRERKATGIEKEL